MPKLRYLSVLLLLAFTACSPQTKPSKPQTLSETIPLTMANLRGHKALYDEGWLVVSSSREALEFAHKHGVQSAHKALNDMIASLKAEGAAYGTALGANIKGGYESAADILKKGTQQSGTILKTSQELVEAELDYSKQSFSQAWSSLIKGNLSLGQRTKKDREALARIPGEYFKALKEDFSNLGEIASSMSLMGERKFRTLWEDAFRRAQQSFLDSYEASGDADNTLGGLVHILYGYLKSLYHGIVRPTAITTAETAYNSAKNIGTLIYLPIGSSISLVGRSVESLGMTLYYSTSVGIKIVSPTVEAGFLSALSLLSLSSVPITYAGGGSLGLINQVGTVALAPVAGVGEATLNTAVDTGKLVLFVSQDLLEGSAKIIFNEAASGVVLGYNALTALPTHLLLAASDAVFFLAWDGPRLVVAVAEGRVGGTSVDSLPVGTVVDLKKLKEQTGVKVKVISEDYKLIEKVLHELPKDMKVK